jgi:hypothetical protein
MKSKVQNHRLLSQIKELLSKKTTFLSNAIILILFSGYLISCEPKIEEKRLDYSKAELRESKTSTDAIDKHSDSANFKINSSEQRISENNKSIQKDAALVSAQTKEPETKIKADNIVEKTISTTEALAELSLAKKEIELIKVENNQIKKDVEANKAIAAEKDKQNSALVLKIEKLEQEAKIAKEESDKKMRGLLMWIKGVIIALGAALTAWSVYIGIVTTSPKAVISAVAGLVLIGLGLYLETYAIWALAAATLTALGYLGYYIHESIKNKNIAVDLVNANQAGKKVLDPANKERFSKELYEAQSFDTMKFVEKVKN